MHAYIDVFKWNSPQLLITRSTWHWWHFQRHGGFKGQGQAANL